MWLAVNLSNYQIYPTISHATDQERRMNSSDLRYRTCLTRVNNNKAIFFSAEICSIGSDGLDFAGVIVTRQVASILILLGPVSWTDMNMVCTLLHRWSLSVPSPIHN
jgi:hypothetical protein